MRWLVEFVMAPNSCEVQGGMLKKLLSSMDDRERCCTVVFDEMDIMGVASYDQQLDQVLGPFKHLQVLLVCGIFKAWKMPMYYAFNQPATKEILFEVIEAVEEAGGRVVSTVNDMGSGNLALWKSLGIGHDAAASIPNPTDPARRIWMLADPPHVMKRLRNNILDKGVTTAAGGRVDRALMEDLLAIDGNAELKVLHKLHMSSHVELVSASSALALRRHTTNKEKEADFIEKIDSGMDVLNSAHPGDVKLLRRGYSGRPEQEEALAALEKEVAGMRVGNARHLYPFQKGLLVTIRAVRGLTKDLQDQYGTETYLLTRKLTQDKFESFFSQVRGRGGSSLNPTPTEAKARIRLLTLLQLARHGVSPKTDAGDANDSAAAAAAQEPEPASPATPEPDGDDDTSPPPQLVELEQLCPEPAEEVPEGTEDLHPESEEPGPDAEEEAEQAAEDEMAQLLSAAEGVRAPSEPSGAVDVHTGVPASDSAAAYLAGYMARKRDRSLGAPAVVYAEDIPVQALWTRLRSVCALTVPTSACLSLFRELDMTFCVHHAIHPDLLSRERGIIANMTTLLLKKHGGSAHPEEKKFIRTFARVRTFIRLRHVNAARRTASSNKRKARKLRHHAQ
ncbi:Transposable element P transposase [Amphibalanus amphitrite]|uniref:Transposable element P transposase n=1 Tax=Amphibalanus amphitrite TaxID=1232801 RepID=A0A6A4V5R2_AMPAM|nr:Transposable element P transposase [Amphibalanus amphitrite]